MRLSTGAKRPPGWSMHSGMQCWNQAGIQAGIKVEYRVESRTSSVPRYRLRELARLGGVEPRTIRSYIHQAVIPGPDQRGRNARYGPVHLDRLRAIVFLRNQRGLSLPAIRTLFTSLTDPDIRAIPSGRQVEAVYADPPSFDPSAGSGALPIMAAALMRGAGRVSDRTAACRASRMPRRLGPIKRRSSWRPRISATAFDDLLSQLQLAVHARSVPRVARGEIWVRIPITPDAELHVRNVADGQALGALVRIADHVRYLLLHRPRSRPRN